MSSGVIYMIKLLIKVENLKSGERQFWTPKKGVKGVEKVAPNFVSCLGTSSTLQSIINIIKEFGGLLYHKTLDLGRKSQIRGAPILDPPKKG